jgi:amidase/aspartyl-tRNA(Asn)/glutamyl-tRNA(Gln) amidotransferase subunit A
MNSVVGIKPTLGTISRAGIIPIAHSQDTAGPLARNVTDAVILLSVMVDADKNDKGYLASNINYISHLKKDGLKGKRIGIARNLMGYHQALDAVFEQAIDDLKEQGAIIVDNTNFAHSKVWGQHEFEVLLYEFKDGLNRYLASTGKNIPKSLYEMIQYNKQHAAIEMPHFAQELFELAQTKGNLSDKTYINALMQAKKLTQEDGIDALLKAYNLDLIIAPTTSPAWKIDLKNGDKYLGSASSAAAISGYPHITLPMGYVGNLPVGISMFSGKLQEGILIEAAYGFEQATLHRILPKLED